MKYITIEKGLGPEGRIAVVRFDRGDNGLNALSAAAMRELRAAARSFGDDPRPPSSSLRDCAAFRQASILKDAEGRVRSSVSANAARR
ncbi:MAG: hypothetical protein U1E19_10050 [Rhodoblastus sp.]